MMSASSRNREIAVAQVQAAVDVLRQEGDERLTREKERWEGRMSVREREGGAERRQRAYCFPPRLTLFAIRFAHRS